MSYRNPRDPTLYEYTNDRIPIPDEAADIPDTYSDYTEESATQLVDDIERLLDEQQGILPESELLANSVIYDSDLAEENMENDYSFETQDD